MKGPLQAIGIIYIVIFFSLLSFAFISKCTGKDKFFNIVVDSLTNHSKIWNICGFFFWLGVIIISLLVF